MDKAGNVQGPHTCTVKIDTTGPVTEAKTTYARFNDTVQLYYMATDNLSPQVTGVAVVVKNARGLTVATITVSAPKSVDTWYSVTWTPRPRGTYRYYVYAEDWGVGSGTNWAAVVVSLGNGDGTFTKTAEYDLSELGSGAMKVADFNRDGYLDLAVVQNSGFDVLLGNGDGTFQTPVTFAHSPQWSGDAVATAGDFNGDGKPDVAVADGKTATIFFNMSN